MNPKIIKSLDKFEGRIDISDTLRVFPRSTLVMDYITNGSLEVDRSNASGKYLDSLLYRFRAGLQKKDWDGVHSFFWDLGDIAIMDNRYGWIQYCFYSPDFPNDDCETAYSFGPVVKYAVRQSYDIPFIQLKASSWNEFPLLSVDPYGGYDLASMEGIRLWMRYYLSAMSPNIAPFKVPLLIRGDFLEGRRPACVVLNEIQRARESGVTLDEEAVTHLEALQSTQAQERSMDEVIASLPDGVIPCDAEEDN